MSVWAFSPRIFPLLEREFIDFLAKLEDPLTSEFYLPAAVDGWIRSGLARVVVRSASCSWMGVTYKEDRPRGHGVHCPFGRGGEVSQPASLRSG